MTGDRRCPDRGRAAVYAAEIAAFEATSYEQVTHLASLQELAAGVMALHWWTAGPISVLAARHGAESSATYQRAGAPPVVRLARPQMTPATLVHELAHALAGVGTGHGPAFRRAHVDLVEHAFGAEPARWLLDGYLAMGVELGGRTWPPPTAHAIV
jgi:putative metallohydrolase (TIGR04338 family)